MCELPAQRLRLDEVRERPLAVDLDDGQELAIPRFELCVPGDVDLVELEWVLGPRGLDDPPRRRAQVALRGVEERDADYG